MNATKSPLAFLGVLLVSCCVISLHGFAVVPSRIGWKGSTTTTTTTRRWSTEDPSNRVDEAENLGQGDAAGGDSPQATSPNSFEAKEPVNGGDAIIAMDDDVPSDVEEQEPVVEFHSQSSQQTDQTVLALLQIAASTGRGEYASSAQKDLALTYVAALEASNPTPEPTKSPLLVGTWELVFSNTQLFRSSPFFMAGRAVCRTPEQAQQYDWFCDMHRSALAISQIGAVRQIISASRLVSEFEVKAGAVPFLSDLTPFSYSGGLPITIDGAICSSADITPTSDGTSLEVYMDTVEIKGSNIPGLRQVLNTGALTLKSRDLASFLEDTSSRLPPALAVSYETPRPVFETTFLSPSLRVSRDQDGKVFVYSKISDKTEPTDYTATLPDLGVAKLLEGLNDTFLKFYI